MSAIDECLAEALAIPGARLVTLFDYASGLPIGARGEDTLTAEEDAAGVADLVQHMLATPGLTAAQGADSIEELLVVGTAGTHVILLGPESLCLHAVFDPGLDLTAVRTRVRAAFHWLVSSG